MTERKTIREALEYVSRHPVPSAEPIDMPVWEHVARGLFETASSPNPKVRGSMARASRAQQMILDRMVGRRRPGSRPVSGAGVQVEFRDLTGGLLERGPSDE